MNIFLSWSGHRSKLLAEVLYEWLPEVIQVIEPWMSSEDIDKGARWATDVAIKLNEAKAGIICLTPENLNSEWLLFEAGALSKILDISLVCPYLLDLDTTDIKGPLVQFQATKSNKEDTKKLLLTINKVIGEKALQIKRLETAFERCWPTLEKKIYEIKNVKLESPSIKKIRTEEDLLEEILERTRWIEKRLSPAKTISKFSDLSLLEYIQSNWNNIINEIKKQHIALGSFLNEGIPFSLKNNNLEIKFEKGNDFHIQSINRNKPLVEKVMEEITGFPVKINCKLEGE